MKDLVDLFTEKYIPRRLNYGLYINNMDGYFSNKNIFIESGRKFRRPDSSTNKKIEPL